VSAVNDRHLTIKALEMAIKRRPSVHCGEAKMQLFDYIEVFYNQRRPASNRAWALLLTPS
jgi:hypothetical protein